MLYIILLVDCFSWTWCLIHVSACILPQRESFHSFHLGWYIYIFCLQASLLSVHHSLIIYCQYNPRPIDHVGCRQSSYNFLCCTATCRRGTLTLGVIACWRRYLIYIHIHRTFCLGRAVLLIYAEVVPSKRVVCFLNCIWYYSVIHYPLFVSRIL